MTNRSSRQGFFLVTPALAFLTALTIFPTAYLIYISLLNWNLLQKGIKFVGLQNFIQILTPGSPFLKAISGTVVFAAGVTTAEFFLGLGVALLLVKESVLSKIVRGVLIVPLMMTPILIDMTWKYLYDPVLGPITFFLSFFGVKIPHFLDALPNVWFSLAIIDIWQWAPFMILILLGGLLSLPTAQYEAAELDGASAWNKFRFVTLPLLKPIISIAILFRLIDSLKVVNKIYILTQGGPGTSTQTLSYHIFYYGLGYTQDISYAAAASIVFLFIVLAISTFFMVFIARGALLGKGTT